MSRETMQWLNTNTLIGFTDKRGTAWHYRASDQGAESNHYAGAIPVADVERRLFNWQALSVPVSVTLPATIDTMTSIDASGAMVRSVALPDRQAIAHSETGDVFGIFKSGYEIHQYREWLLNTVSTLLSDTLSIGSAGLLKAGALAWVSVEVPDTVRTPEGVEFRPNLLATTSHDGSLSTTYKRVVTNVVCDNTHAVAMGEHGQQLKVKHSRYSQLKLASARDALSIIHTVADDFAAEVKALCEMAVSDKAWSGFLDAHVPLPEAKGRSLSMAENKRERLTQLWKSDNRVAPWRGTGWGVVQAVNTYAHHEGIVRGAERAERNMLRAVTGGIDTLDTDTISTLGKVLANA